MTTDEKLDLILSRLDAIEAKIGAAPAPVEPTVEPQPQPTTGLYRFVRPAVRNVDQWPVNRDMTSPDPYEAFERALHGVNWRGGQLADQTYEEAWAEIEALKSGDEALIAKYRMLDPEFAGFALLTGLISASKWDDISFGVNAGRRQGFAGYTIESFISAQFGITGTPGVGGE